MTAPYVVRLLCICLAAFFLIYLAAGLVVSFLAPFAIRIAERLRPGRAARILLVLRLLPFGIAAVAVGGLCVPSYLWLEPAGTSEEVGLSCLGAALLALAGWTISSVRSWRASARSLGYIRYCRSAGHRAPLGIEAEPAWILEGRRPFLVIAGILKPRLMVSSVIVDALPAEQLAMALRHEHAHRKSRDNLKRLFLLLAPDILPFWRAFAVLDRAWARYTEWAADDFAVAGDSARSLALAAALVQVARMGACPQAPPLVTSLLADGQDLAQRVDRLLVPPSTPETRPRPWLTLTGTLAAACLIAAMLQPTTLYAVHRLLEHLTH